jgi:spore coat protein U-like protein
MKRMLGGALALLAAPAILSGVVQAAQTLPAELGVSLEIVEACTVGTVVPVAFGTQGTLAAEVNAEGSVEVTCPAGTEYSVALDAGAADGATVATRKMTWDDKSIDYSLYQDANHEQVWGDVLGVGGNARGFTGTGDAQIHPIYAKVPIQSTPAVGTYQDTVTIVVHY